MSKSQIEFTLSNKLTFHNKGEVEVTDLLTLVAPCNKQIHMVSKLKQLFLRALHEATKSSKEPATEKSSDESDITADQLVMGLYMSTTVEISDVMDVFKKLLISGSCYVGTVTKDSKTELTDALYDKLDYEDTEKMLGEYLLNFLLSSLTSLQKKK